MTAATVAPAAVIGRDEADGPVAFVLRYERLSGWHEPPGRLPAQGEYLVGYDPDADAGRGVAEFAASAEHAIRFATAEDAARLVETPSAARPTREDGRPNRPLTAFVMFVVRDPLGRPHHPDPEEQT